MVVPGVPGSAAVTQSDCRQVQVVSEASRKQWDAGQGELKEVGVLGHSIPDGVEINTPENSPGTCCLGASQ